MLIIEYLNLAAQYISCFFIFIAPMYVFGGWLADAAHKNRTKGKLLGGVLGVGFGLILLCV